MTLFFCFISINAVGQKLLQLTRHKTKERFFILQEERVKCKFLDGTNQKGIIRNISDSTFELNNRVYLLDSVKSIAKRKKGAIVLILFVEATGITLIFTGQIKTYSQMMILGLIQSYLIAKPSYNYLMRSTKKWNIEIVDIVPRKDKIKRDEALQN